MHVELSTVALASVCMWSACGRLSVTMVMLSKAYRKRERERDCEALCLSPCTTWRFLHCDSLQGLLLVVISRPQVFVSLFHSCNHLFSATFQITSDTQFANTSNNTHAVKVVLNIYLKMLLFYMTLDIIFYL